MITSSEYFRQLIAVQEQLCSEQAFAIDLVGQVLYDCWANHDRLWMIANGGSQAIISHACADFSKGLTVECGHAMDCHCWADNIATATAWANDTSYATAAENWVGSGILGAGDVVLIASVSGKSENCVNAINEANRLDCTTIALTGQPWPNRVSSIATHRITVPSIDYQLTEDVFASLLHYFYKAIVAKHKEG